MADNAFCRLTTRGSVPRASPPAVVTMLVSWFCSLLGLLLLLLGLLLLCLELVGLRPGAGRPVPGARRPAAAAASPCAWSASPCCCSDGALGLQARLLPVQLVGLGLQLRGLAAAGPRPAPGACGPGRRASRPASSAGRAARGPPPRRARDPLEARLQPRRLDRVALRVLDALAEDPLARLERGEVGRRAAGSWRPAPRPSSLRSACCARGCASAPRAAPAAAGAGRACCSSDACCGLQLVASERSSDACWALSSLPCWVSFACCASSCFCCCSSCFCCLGSCFCVLVELLLQRRRLVVLLGVLGARRRDGLELRGDLQRAVVSDSEAGGDQVVGLALGGGGVGGADVLLAELEARTPG